MKKIIIVFVALILAQSAAVAADFKVIVHPDVNLAAIPKGELAKIILRKSSKFSDGTKAQPVDLAANSPIREAFSLAVHGRSTSKIESFWQRQIFSGRNVPPPQLASDAEVIAHVGKTPGGIGYVSDGAKVTGTVKVVNVVE
jgi:ABC-type phosphate transport system substrate-binding protein